jgi:spermidine/putrescine transport system substrate-binding protein
MGRSNDRRVIPEVVRSYSRRDVLARAGGLVATTTLGGSLLAACGGSDSPGEGKVGGTLDTLMWPDYVAKPVTGKFQSSQDVTIDNSPIGTNEEVFTRLRAEGPGSFDAASPGTAYVEPQVAAGLLNPIDLDRIPNTANLFPRFKDVIDERLTFGGKVYGVPVGWGLDTMVYNKTKIPNPPKSWKDVLKPEYEGKVLLSEGPQPNFEIWPRVVGGWDPTRLTQEQLDETTDFLIELKRTHVRAIASSADDIAKLFASGEVWIGASGADPASATVANKKGGDEVAFTIPEEGAATWVDSLVIPAEPRNEATAYAFLNYMLEPEPQASHAVDFSAGTVIKGAVPLVTEANRKQMNYNDVDSLAERAPVFVFPPTEEGFTTPADWSDAWARIAAA